MRPKDRRSRAAGGGGAVRTTVVNIRTGAKFDVYCGRARGGLGGTFGNPYVLGPDGDRAEVIRKFRIYFHDRLKLDPTFRAAVEGLRGKILACFCKPLECHSDVIVEWLETTLPDLNRPADAAAGRRHAPRSRNR